MRQERSARSRAQVDHLEPCFCCEPIGDQRAVTGFRVTLDAQQCADPGGWERFGELVDVDSREDLAAVALRVFRRQLHARALTDTSRIVDRVLQPAQLRRRRQLRKMAIFESGEGERILESLGVRPRVLRAAHAAPLANIEYQHDVGVCERVQEALERGAIDADGSNPASHSSVADDTATVSHESTTHDDLPGRADGRPDVLIVGDPAYVARALVEPLLRLGLSAKQVVDPTDVELIEELRAGVGAVAVVSRDDPLALRLTLLASHVAPEVPLLTTLFDETVAEQLRLAVPGVLVVSPSQLVAPQLAEACIGAQGPPRRGRRQLRRRGPMIVDGALQLLLLSGAGLLAAFLLEAFLSGFVLHESWENAIYSSATTLATVTGSSRVAHAPGWYKLLSATGILLSLGLVAVFTAALVGRLSQLRLTTLLGSRAAPRSDHVLIVGLGQIGLRLALRLRSQGVQVLGVEVDASVAGVRLAHEAGLPVVIASGADAHTLRRLGIRRARAVAAVTSDDLVNVGIGLAARATAPDVAVVLRLGDGDVAAETESLLHLGRIFDAHRLAAESIAEALRSRL